jgi:hypothetical protein
MMPDETRFIAVYNERTGLETWRRVAGGGHWVQVAMAQGRVCAAGNRQDPNYSAPLLIIGCYGAGDGAVLWETEFDVSLPGFLSVNTTPAALTMTGKTLVVRTGGNPMGFGAIVSLLLDPDTGATR